LPKEMANSIQTFLTDLEKNYEKYYLVHLQKINGDDVNAEHYKNAFGAMTEISTVLGPVKNEIEDMFIQF
jgi:hypothetical protein